MTASKMFEKFKNIFGYIADNAVSYQEIRNDRSSIRVFMKDGTIYIFTYPANRHYTLICEKPGGIPHVHPNN